MTFAEQLDAAIDRNITPSLFPEEATPEQIKEIREKVKDYFTKRHEEISSVIEANPYIPPVTEESK